jgi:hypothetical protein
MLWGSRYAAAALVLASICAILFAQSPTPPTPTLAVAAHMVPAPPSGMQFLCGTQAPYGEWRQIAEFIGGTSTNGYSLSPEQRVAWDHHAEVTSAAWANEQNRYLSRIDTWRRRTVDHRWNTDVAFYPFSGPDAANMFTFFPDAREYVMIGLEPVGCIPAGIPDYTPRYFSALRRSLDAILTINYFRTNDMQRDFSSDNLRGVLPALLFLVSRSGFTVTGVTPVTITRDGAIERPREGLKGETSGVAIQFTDGRKPRQLLYFSLNLQDSRLLKKPGTQKYLASLPETETLIKSASYLMHRPYFSIIRATILAKSRLVIEDDSGIPFRYFDSSAWDVHLHGAYDKPIDLFSNWNQDDLKVAFSRPGVQPLDFAIGYRHLREANLLVATRRAK